MKFPYQVPIDRVFCAIAKLDDPRVREYQKLGGESHKTMRYAFQEVSQLWPSLQKIWSTIPSAWHNMYKTGL